MFIINSIEFVYRLLFASMHGLSYAGGFLFLLLLPFLFWNSPVGRSDGVRCVLLVPWIYCWKWIHDFVNNSLALICVGLLKENYGLICHCLLDGENVASYNAPPHTFMFAPLMIILRYLQKLPLQWHPIEDAQKSSSLTTIFAHLRYSCHAEGIGRPCIARCTHERGWLFQYSPDIMHSLRTGFSQ